jgi:hypothetical protein
MKLVYLLLALWAFPALLTAQTNSLPARIATARQELRSAFVANDPAAAALWMDSLTRLENSTYVGLVWDERWLLYFWEEAYGNMFDEVARFDAAEWGRQGYKIKPPADSLFEILDQALYEQRFEMYNRLQQGFLNEEERAFSVLQLDYLLRLNPDKKDWAARLDAFLSRYPASRFADYVRSIRPEIITPGRRGFGFSAAYANGNWTGALDHSLTTLNALEVEIYIWRKGWHFGLNSLTGSPVLGRRIEHHGFNWLQGDGTYFRDVGLEVGRDLLDNDRLRITPSVGVYLSTLSPAPPLVGENPDYYSEFYFGDGHLAAALTADLKLFNQDWHLVGIEKGTFHGLRLRAGYHWLRMGRQNPAFGGNLFYFALGYHLFLQRPSK